MYVVIVQLWSFNRNAGKVPTRANETIGIFAFE